MSVIHCAGTLRGGVQRCTRCGTVLSDYRGAMWPEGQPPPRGWEVCASVEVFNGNPRYSVIVADEPTCLIVELDDGGYEGPV